jgi:hypothetical protein
MTEEPITGEDEEQAEYNAIVDRHAKEKDVLRARQKTDLARLQTLFEEEMDRLETLQRSELRAWEDLQWEQWEAPKRN